ncbi:hypothetical protein KY285_034052 [Solanum tuberosum]|nr:hypothetical protein KY285_034052 [Solanum tuberosum]
MFTQDQEIMKLTAMVLPIIGLCELGNCPQTTCCGVLRGTARPKLGANTNWEDQARRAKELINGDYDNQDNKTEDYLESFDYHKLENSNV